MAKTDPATVPPGYFTSAAPVVRDWGETVSFSPAAYFRPGSLDELSAIILLVASGAYPGGRLRFLGGLHSCSNVFKSDIVVDTSGLPLSFDVGPGNMVTASGWMHAHEFLERAAKVGLSLTALGGTDAQTLGGLISTNTAGATVHASVYETVTAITFMTLAPDGKSVVQKTVSATDQDFAGAIASLGAVGFITEVSFKLVPELYFTGSFTMQPVADILGDIATTCANHDFWRIEWLPGDCAKGLFWNAEPCPKPADPNGDYPEDHTERWVRWLINEDDKLLHCGPFSTEALIAAYGVIEHVYSPMTATGPMRYIIPCDRVAPLHVAMAEWSFRPDDLPTVMDLCRAYFKASKWPNLPVEIECTRTDNYLMSPWNFPGLDYIVKLNFQYMTDNLTPQEVEEIRAHLKGLWQVFLDNDVPFKAHWGKLNYMTKDFVAERYKLADFSPSVQPIFLNDYLETRLVGGTGD
jgi:hypothetical protein